MQKSEQQWQLIDCKGVQPKRRMQHASDFFGGIMLVMGGLVPENCFKVLDDFNLFDLYSKSWLGVQVRLKSDMSIFKSKSNVFEDKFQQNRDPKFLNERRSHRVCGVW